MSTKKSKPVARLRHLLLWYRREVAALCAVASIFCIVFALAPRPAKSTQVFVAASSLSAGTKLSAQDFTARDVPDEYLPEDVISDSSQLVGRTLTANLGSGTMLTNSVIFGSQQSSGSEKLVPFRVDDTQVVSLLKVGDVISVVANSSDGTSQTVASNVKVAALPEVETAEFGGAQTGALVVVSADEQTANALASASAQSKLGIVFG
ncbi:SAF domain-containing protein [Propionimicrobium sp. BV2F7]|uniref:SAF domain-containing protein n=1 Tax=Propionimicrobium lymphophilum TaxID=33012 RepID=UPI0003D79935|nr:SAF domain protein [Propionimicrobium sp. BV2F7]